MYHLFHVSAGHIVSFQLVARNGAQSGLVGFNHGRHDDVRRHVTDTHQEQLDERNLYTRHLGRKPEKERHVVKEYDQKDDDTSGQYKRKISGINHIT